MTLILTLLACNVEATTSESPGPDPDFAYDDASHDCAIVDADPEEIPTDWGEEEAAPLLAHTPTTAMWNQSRDPSGSVSDPLSVTAVLVGSHWIRREDPEGRGFCPTGVELAMDVDLAWQIGDDDVVGDEVVVIYASGPTEGELRAERLSLPSEMSEEWTSATEAAELAEHDRTITVTRAWIWLDGAWAAPDLGVSAWYKYEDSGGDMMVRRGTWAFPE